MGCLWRRDCREAAGRGKKTYGGGLAGIDVADNDDVDVSLLVLTAQRLAA